jgi:two-component system, OmpR family, sensor kinase
MSLRLKLFLTYTLIVVVALFFALLGSAVLLRQYADRLAADSLDDTARPISVQLGALVRGSATLVDVIGSLQEQADINNVNIYFTDASGEILNQFTPQGSNPVSFDPGTLPQGITSVVRGQAIASDGRTYLYSAYTLAKAPQQITRARILLIAVPEPRVGAVLSGILRPFFFAGIIALAASILVAYWLSRSLYKPLGEITEAADKIGRGEYSHRINSRDTGEIGALAGSFDRMASEVEGSQVKLQNFVADVSHELKSPLTAIQGFSQALIDGTAADKETQTKAARIINEEAKRLRRQVDELLDLSRLQSGQFKMDICRIDLTQVIKQSTELFKMQAADKSVTLDLDASPGLWINGDSDRLEQVFNNLFDNAIKNSPPFTTINISAARNENRIFASVLDHGPGIHPDALPRVFDRFYQVTGMRTGVGLGLAITREIILAHNGTIDVKSVPGSGAEFILSLPSVN